MQTVIRSVHVKPLLFFTIVDDDIEASRHRNEELVAGLERMSSTVGTSRNIVEVKHSLDVEGNVPAAFYEGKVTPRVSNFLQLD
jgi:hypothetical protein